MLTLLFLSPLWLPRILHFQSWSRPNIQRLGGEWGQTLVPLVTLTDWLRASPGCTLPACPGSVARTTADAEHFRHWGIHARQLWQEFPPAFTFCILLKQVHFFFFFVFCFRVSRPYMCLLGHNCHKPLLYFSWLTLPLSPLTDQLF